MTNKQNDLLVFGNCTDKPADRERSKDRTFINRYLREYRRAESELRAYNFTKKFSPDRGESDTPFRAKMYEIKLFVATLPQGCERMFLYYYYIKGLTMERCAEALGISRRSVYRLKLKALDFALENYKKHEY